MSDLILLSKAQMRKIGPYFPLSHGVPRVDDQLTYWMIINPSGQLKLPSERCIMNPLLETEFFVPRLVGLDN